MTKKVLAMVPGFDSALPIFEGIAEVDSVWGKKDRSYTEEEIAEIVPRYDACIVWIDAMKGRALEAGKDLKAIGVPRAGFDNVDIVKATELGIPVVYSPGANSVAVADFTIGMLIALVRGIAMTNHSLKSGSWNERWALLPSPGFNLEGKVLGIIGLGNIGCRVALRARAFGMETIAYDPYVDDETMTALGLYPREMGVRLTTLEALLKDSDIVTIHTPITTESRGMIDERELRLMKPTSYLIQTSRGGVVDEKALYRALKERRIQGAALDVYEKEPLDENSPLASLDNVIITPHIAWCTREAIRRSNNMVATAIASILKNERPPAKYLANPLVLGRK